MRKTKRITGRIKLLFLAALIVIMGTTGVNYLKNVLYDPQNENIITSIWPTSKENTGKDNTANTNIYSAHAILLNLKDGKVLFSKASNEKTYPASLTKIMTAILAIENIPDLQKNISLDETVYDKLVKENASMAGFLPNEDAKAIDLLYGTILPSGADAATALADEVAGSQDQFVDLMNQKAKDLGMNHSHFTNVTGLHNPDHYTTAKDLSILLQYALKNQTFRKVFTTKKYSTSPTNKNPKGITFTSTLFQNMKSAEFNGGKIIGGKTGYTDEAGLCLASLAKKGNSEYILISTDATGNHNTEQFDITDAKKVYGKY